MNNQLMDYLAKAEGDYIHKNRTERDVTSAYGIYRRDWPNAEIFTWYEDLLASNGKTINLLSRANRKFLKQIIKDNSAFKEMEKMLAWDFFSSKFMKDSINRLVSDKIELTFFSLSVNGGMRRGVKAIQSAVSELMDYPLVVDGICGYHTLSAIKEYVNSSSYDEDKFNKAMLDYMRGFYAYLIRMNPNKYAMYKNGWENRLRKLA